MRLPADQASFASFKLACAVKLGLVGAESKDITLLLGSNVPNAKLDSRAAPEIEALDEISPDDTLFVVVDAALTRSAEEDQLRHGDATAPSLGGGVVAAQLKEEEDDDDNDDDDDGGDDDDDDGGDDDDDYNEGVVAGSTAAGTSSSQKRPRTPATPRTPKAPKPTMEAVLDDDTETVAASSGSAGGGGSTEPAADDSEMEKVKQRVRKMLSRGLHVGTPETEVASSMRLAEKLLAKHNLKQESKQPPTWDVDRQPRSLHVRASLAAGWLSHYYDAAALSLMPAALKTCRCTQADVLEDDHVPESLRAGKTCVNLRSTAPPHTACTTKQWMHTLGHGNARTSNTGLRPLAHCLVNTA